MYCVLGICIITCEGDDDEKIMNNRSTFWNFYSFGILILFQKVNALYDTKNF